MTRSVLKTLIYQAEHNPKIFFSRALLHKTHLLTIKINNASQKYSKAYTDAEIALQELEELMQSTRERLRKSKNSNSNSKETLG